MPVPCNIVDIRNCVRGRSREKGKRGQESALRVEVDTRVVYGNNSKREARRETQTRFEERDTTA